MNLTDKITFIFCVCFFTGNEWLKNHSCIIKQGAIARYA